MNSEEEKKCSLEQARVLRQRADTFPESAVKSQLLATAQSMEERVSAQEAASGHAGIVAEKGGTQERHVKTEPPSMPHADLDPDTKLNLRLLFEDEAVQFVADACAAEGLSLLNLSRNRHCNP